jgi:uncharacterized membrane protein
MKKFNLIIAAVVLIVALFLLFDKLFTPQTFQITLETGQEVTSQTPEYFPLQLVLLCIICAFFIGAASIHIYYNAELQQIAKVFKKENLEEKYTQILSLLKPDERKVVVELLGAKGEMLQSGLVSKLGISKVKATRILHRLLQKGLIVKERHGFTNKIILKAKETGQ